MEGCSRWCLVLARSARSPSLLERKRKGFISDLPEWRFMSSVNEGSGTVCLTVDPGVCRFRTRIVAKYVDGNIQFAIDSDCPHVKKLKGQLKEDLSPFDALRMPFSANPVYEACGKVLAHSACPVPSAMIKSAEAAAGFGIKRSVRFDFDC
jgi:hypothetical protein